MNKILITTDFSEASRSAFQAAIEQAQFRKLSGVEIDLVCVLEDLAPASVQFEFGFTTFDTKSLLDEAEKHAKARLDKYAAEYFSEFTINKTVIRGTKPTAVELAEFAANRGTNLIVVASHGRTGLKRLALGSVTESLLREVSCPVLVVPCHRSK